MKKGDIDYEKLYNETLKVLKTKFKDFNEIIISRKDIEDIFPELKESEDEKIRKSLIEWMKEFPDTTWKCHYKKDVIAWLEKQGTPQVRNGLEWVNTIDDACDKRYSEEYADGEYCHEQSFKWGFQEGVEWLEKQDKKVEPIEGFNSEFEKQISRLIASVINKEHEYTEAFIKWVSNAFLNYAKHEIEKQGEKEINGNNREIPNSNQKQDVGIQINPSEYINDMGGNGCYLKNITEKAEPKLNLKVGKWYVCTDTFVSRGKIVAIKGQTYQSQQDSTLICEDNCLFIDKHDGNASDYFRYWTIEDAKDGDVLYSLDSNQPFIYKVRNGYEQATVYCGLDIYGEFFVWGIITLVNYVPATKEQRNQLEKAMADAGYTFDFDKKELKEVEHIPFWSKEDEEAAFTISPELKGSDKIKAEIIDFIKTYVKAHGCTLMNQWIAWLEKQGKQKSITKIDDSHFKRAEGEKADFVSGQYVQCRKSFDDFKEYESYWFEYLGDDTYIGRSDNILNRKFHITPRQLFTLFSQQHDYKQDEKQVEQPAIQSPMSYGKEIDEAMYEAWRRYDLPYTDANKYSLADVFHAGVRASENRKCEWSEEDERLAKKDAFNEALDKIEYNSGEPTFDDGWDAAMKYVKTRVITTNSNTNLLK